MRVTEAERVAVRMVLAAGRMWGYGNLIAHLQTAWAAHLMEEGTPERVAREASGGPGYPFQLQRDVLERGEWDETGERYRS
jgi:hypothetical protein